MQAELFYVTPGEEDVDLYFISESQWKEGLEILEVFDKQCLKSNAFTGKLGEVCVIHNANGQIIKAYVGSGTGDHEQTMGCCALLLPPASYRAQAILSYNAVLAWSLGQYRFDTYKTQELKPRLLVVKPEDLVEIMPLAQAIFFTRDLINTPANDMGPENLAKTMQDLAKTNAATFKQWVGEELLEENFPAIYTVGRASSSAPRLLSLIWGEQRHPKVTLIGKGVCFDSGGLDIKPSSNMRLMKKDMGGAAITIGLAQWIMTKQLPIRLHVLIPAVENAIGPNAFRPGDVITMRNRLTVEIDNTDAEGRLILADAFVKACEDKPELIIDFSTLTGAARMAVGTEISAMFCNSEKLAANLLEASIKSADPIWRLPLFSPYDDLLKSSCADLVNSSPSSYAGAITAALFLQHFIETGIDWVHFDTMAWNVSSKPGKPEGGEAMGLRTVAQYLQELYEK